MTELDNLKVIIDEQLALYKVTDSLKRKVYHKLNKEDNSPRINIKRNSLRFTTTFSLIVMVLSISINILLPRSKTYVTPPHVEPYLSHYPLSNNIYDERFNEEKYQETDDCEDSYKE